VPGGFPPNWGLSISDIGYGYQWWSARAGDHRYNLAWGHGGQQIVLLDRLDIVIVVTSHPFWPQHDAEAWKHELANINLVGNFIKSLPSE
jgi:CubicO group peptidase (beta-lactamase class C family)